MIEKLILKETSGNSIATENKINEIIDYLNCEDQQDLTMEMEIEQAEKKAGLHTHLNKPAEQTERDKDYYEYELNRVRTLGMVDREKVDKYRSALEKIIELHKIVTPNRDLLIESACDIAKTSLEGGEK